MRVLIVGSGIGGLAVALALRQVGFEVVVYERAPELREVGAGISLWANALRALDYLGAGDAVRAVSLPMRQSEMRACDGFKVQLTLSAEYFEQQYAVRPFVAMVHRAELVAVLAARLPSGVTRYGFECVGVEQDDRGATVRFKNGHADTADLVVGADGLNSAVRAALFGPQPPRYAGHTCWRGVGPRPAAVAPGYLGEWWGRGRRFGITTLPGDRVYWFAVLNAPTGEHAADERSAVLNAFRGWAAPVEELVDSTPADRVIRNDILDRPPAKPWHVGRVGLVGDAAHPTTPNFGQGGCMAIEDAVVLARRVRAAATPAAAWEGFTAERFKRTAAITNESWRFGSVAQWESPLACRLRDGVFGLLFPLVGKRQLPKHAAFDVGPL
ncbi:FAD-dependent monooxygenase [Urbifossiella limnaea]|uniref:FAD-dependent urate hydroxylase n=1 Tax=Urbifossiella limnaea TaxID=2528023 RepID=A0A517XXG9_9BACT|nr:FAD-dependent monooxygenase [Urbifossiella limnaea]QDU22217.1 FAD-dependent urate hydroxylase [Urbifossiella limnaea]